MIEQMIDFDYEQSLNRFKANSKLISHIRL